MAKRKPKHKHTPGLARVDAIGHLKAEVVTAEIDNPDWRPDREGDRAFPRKHPASRNVRESEIAFLHARKAIDDSQLAAGDMFRKLFEAMGSSGARAIDWRREAVDGGRLPDPIGQHAIDAGKKLASAHARLTAVHGEYSWRIVTYVCGQSKSVQHDLTYTRREKEAMLENLRMYLNVLAGHWGFSTKTVAMNSDCRRRA